MILTDTYVLVWALLDIDRIGKRARAQIDGEFEGSVAVSSIVFWEIATLVSRKRMALERSVVEFRRDVLNLGIEEVPVTGDIAITAGELSSLHGDPADRLIVATALVHEAKLATANGKILAWKSPLRRIDARR